MKDHVDKSMGIITRIVEALTRIKATETLRLAQCEARKKPNYSDTGRFLRDPKCLQWQTGRRWDQVYPRISDDKTESSFWLPCWWHHQDEEHRWRTLCVWVFRLYLEWYVWNDHLWREQGIRECGPRCCITLFINRLPNLPAAPS